MQNAPQSILPKARAQAEGQDMPAHALFPWPPRGFVPLVIPGRHAVRSLHATTRDVHASDQAAAQHEIASRSDDELGFEAPSAARFPSA
jgi:hypothetical protein